MWWVETLLRSVSGNDGRARLNWLLWSVFFNQELLSCCHWLSSCCWWLRSCLLPLTRCLWLVGLPLSLFLLPRLLVALYYLTPFLQRDTCVPILCKKFAEPVFFYAITWQSVNEDFHFGCLLHNAQYYIFIIKKYNSHILSQHLSQYLIIYY